MRIESNTSPKFVVTSIFNFFLILAFCSNLILPSLSYGQEIDLDLPAPSKIKPTSKAFNPAVIRAITIDPNDPFLFDFIIDKGDANLDAAAFEAETQKLVKYFLAALTIPETDLWVNLSPYEQDAMVSPVLGVTELGKDLLVQDYYLKQVTAAMTNPNTPTGKKFWEQAYAKAQELYGNTNVPINTFSKVWIVPDQAIVLEKDGSAFIADSHLKVFLDQDYFAVKKNIDNKEIGTDKLGTQKTQDINEFSSQLMKDIVLPEIEKEVNTGENFAAVRQIYSAAILATWYKERLKESILGKLYADKNKVAGVNADDMDAGEKIFEKYTAALKTGAYNLIKQDYDLSSQKIVQRKYFSGGVQLASSAVMKYVQMDNLASANLSPANSQAIQTVMASGAQGNLVRATVRLGNASSSVFENVNTRLASPRGSALAANGRADETLVNLGVYNISSASNDVTSPMARFDDSLTTDLSAIESLSRASEAEVESIAARTGLASQPLQTLRAKIVASAQKVKSTEYRQVFRSFVTQVRQTLSPSARQNLAQVSDLDQQSITSLAAIGEATDDEFNNVTQDFSPEQKSDLAYAREKVQTLGTGQTVMNLIANNDTRLNRVLASPALPTFANRPAKVAITQAERQAVAVIFASKPDGNTRVALTRMGFSSEEIAYMMSADENGRKKLIATVEQSADRFLSLARIDPTIVVALKKVANPKSNIIGTEEEYQAESTNLYSDLVKQGLNRETIDQVVKVRAELKTAVLDAQNFTSDDVVRSIWAAGFSPQVESFVQTLREKTALMNAFIAQEQVSLNVVNRQMSAAQKLVEMDDQALNSFVLDDERLGLSLQDKNAIRSDVALARDLRKLNSQAKIFSGRNGAAIARAVTNPDFVDLVSSVRASSAISAVSAVLAADYLTNDGKATEFFTARFTAEAAEQSGNTKYVPLSAKEVGAVSVAVKSVASVNPSSFADRSRFESAVISQLKETGVPVEEAVSLGTRAGRIYDAYELAQLRTREVPPTLAASTREEVNAKAVAAYLYDVYSTAYVRPGRTGNLPKALQSKKVVLADVKSWVKPSQANTNEAKAFFRLPEVSRVWGEISPAARRALSPATPIQNILASVQVADRASVTTIPQDDKLYAYLSGIANNSSRTGEEFNPQKTAVSLRAIAYQASQKPEFAQRVSEARNVGELVSIVGEETQADAQFAQNVSRDDIASLTDSDLKTVGGIDLSADKMGLQIKRDGKGVPLPISQQDMKNIQIDGLVPVILDVQPASPATMPFLLNLANGTPSK